jgi:ankyrin repeat protein
VVRLLHQEQADPNKKDEMGETPVLEAVREGMTGVFKLLLQNRGNVEEKTEQQYTALHLAALSGKSSLAKILLSDHGTFDVNAKSKDTGSTALHLAVQHDNEAVVALMAKEHPRVDCNLRNKAGLTALSLAAKANLSLVKVLVSEARLEVPLLQEPLLEAVREANLPVCEFLLEQRANLVDCTDADENNALHLVARNGSQDVATFLLEQWGDDFGSALAHKNKQDKTPLDEANIKDNDRVERAFIAKLRAPRQESVRRHLSAVVETRQETEHMVQSSPWFCFAPPGNDTTV